MNWRYKMHEWLADHVNWIQYPNLHKIRPVRVKPDWQPYQSSPIIEVEQHSGEARLSFLGNIVLLLYALIAGVIGLAGLAFGGLVLWVVISSLF